MAVPMANPLVALFSAPACPAGSTMRVSFQVQSGATPATYTNWANCDGVHTMSFEIAGMYPTTTYTMFSQTMTGGNMVNGDSVTFTTGALPDRIPFPAFKANITAGPN